MCLAIPGKILEIHGEESLWRMGRVDFGGVIKEISLACVPDAKTGEHVIVHAGVAISRLDETEAERLLQALRAIDDLAPPKGGEG